MARSNTELARIVFEKVWGEGQVDLIDELYDPDFVALNPVPGISPTHEGLKMEVQGYRRAFPDLTAIPHEIIGCGDEVVVRYTVRGTHKGDMMGVPPTSRRAEVQGVNIMHVEAHYPMLRGTIRDHATGERRPFIRFFANGQDLSHDSPDAPLPDTVASGVERLLIVGAIAGG